MKGYSVIWIIIVCLLIGFVPGKAQTFSEWFNQKSTQKKYLIQQIIKLQEYLAYTKKGYDIINKGLTSIGKIKDGDYKLHSLFFKSKYVVKSPIKNYFKVKGCKENIYAIKEKANKIKQLLSNTQMIIPDNKHFIEKQIDNMLLQLLEDARALNHAVSDNVLQMNDNERLFSIDKTYQSVFAKNGWITNIYENCKLLSTQREREMQNLEYLQQFNSVK